MLQISAKEYKTKHCRVGKVIHWELCKKLKFNNTNKWYMHNTEVGQENETQKVFWDFEIQIDHQISVRQSDQVRVNKKRESAK